MIAFSAMNLASKSANAAGDIGMAPTFFADGETD